jgi:hypothetical protein
MDVLALWFLFGNFLGVAFKVKVTFFVKISAV